MKKELTYDDWYDKADPAGIDWDNDPPPHEILDDKLCIAALRDAPWHLEKIPVDKRTPNVCFAAVYQDDNALQFVPEHLREEVKAHKDAITEDEWLLELSIHLGQDESHYQKLTAKLLRPDFLRAMVTLNPYTIYLVPEELQTPELLAIVESLDADAIYDENWDRYWMEKEYKGDFKAILAGLTSEEACLAAVQEDGNIIKYIPEALRTEAVCRAAAHAIKIGIKSF